MTLQVEERDIAAVDLVARQYKSYFPMVDYEDIRQELWAAFFSKPELIEQWRRDGSEGDKALYWHLRNAARRFCNQEKAAIVGYDVDDLHFYSNASLEIILPLAFDREFDGAPTLGEDRVKSKSDPAEGGNLLAMVMDVRCALEAVKRDDSILFYRAYGRGEKDLDRLAGELGITREAARKRLERALGRLRRELSDLKTPTPEPHRTMRGRRHVMSNAAANATIRKQERGE